MRIAGTRLGRDGVGGGGDDGDGEFHTANL